MYNRVRFKTGIVGVDKITYGLPVGITEVYGPPSSGKTSFVVSCLEQRARAGMTSAYVSCETDPLILLNSEFKDSILHARAAKGEAVLEAASELLNNGARMVAIDPVDFLISESERRQDVGSRVWSASKRMLFHWIHSVRPTLAENNSSVLMVAQVRKNPKINNRSVIQSSTSHHLERVTDLRLLLDRRSTKTEYGKLVHSEVSARVISSRYRYRKDEVIFHIGYGKGVDRNKELVRYLQKEGKIERRGAFWKLPNGNLIGPGWNSLSSLDEDTVNYMETI